MSCFTGILSAGLAAGLLLTVRPAAAQEETSFKLAGTDTYIRHQNSQGVLSKIGFNDNVARKDATFRLQFGLAGKCVSLESVNFPGQYLRHQNFWIVLAKNDNSPLFKSDATFCTKNPLPMGSQTMFESVNNPGLFISNVGGKLKILQSANTGDSGGTRPSNAARPRTQTDRTEPLSIRVEQAVRSTEFVTLANRPDLAPTVADWIWCEWSKRDGYSLQKIGRSWGPLCPNSPRGSAAGLDRHRTPKNMDGKSPIGSVPSCSHMSLARMQRSTSLDSTEGPLLMM